MADVYTSEAPGIPAALYSGPQYTPSPVPSGQDSHKRSYEDFAADNTTDSDDDSSVESTDYPVFDPEKHLVFHGTVKTHSMDDIGLPMTNGISPVAVSEPFPLFSEEAVNIMRAEVLAEDVLENYSWTSDIAPKQVRGYAQKYVQFLRLRSMVLTKDQTRQICHRCLEAP
jgi:hypothetical protein